MEETDLTLLEKADWRGAYLEMSKTARDNAEASDNAEFRKTWNTIADDWEFLARLQDERCACGCPAVGAKHFEGGTRVPYCGKHLNKVIVSEILTRAGLKKPN